MIKHESGAGRRPTLSIAGVAGIATLLWASQAFAQDAAPSIPPAAPSVVAPPIAATPPMGAPMVSAPAALTQPPAAQAAPMSSCDSDMQKLQQRRAAQIEQINKVVKGGKGGKIDPVAACPRFRGLLAVENEMRAWMLKNKDWCSIPDEVIENMKVGFSKTPVYAQRACAAAEQIRRGGPMGGAVGAIAPQPAVKLPAGPL